MKASAIVRLLLIAAAIVILSSRAAPAYAGGSAANADAPSGATNPISTAITLVCAWSQVYCDSISQVQPTVAPLLSPTVGAEAETVWRNQRPVAIHIRPDIDHPAAVASLIVHEETNVMAGFHVECGEWESDGYQAQIGFQSWFTHTFGMPDFSGGGPSYAVWLTPSRAPIHVC